MTMRARVAEGPEDARSRGSRRRASGAAAALLATMAGLTACSGQGAPAPSPSSSEGAPRSSGATTPATTTLTATASTAAQAPPATTPASATSLGATPGVAEACRVVTLDMNLVRLISRGPVTYRRFQVTNKGPVPCVVGGYPGVSLVESDATTAPIGAPADRVDTGDAHAETTLAPGKSTTFDLSLAEGSLQEAQCNPVGAVGLRIIPPGETNWVLLKGVLTGCANPDLHLLQVSPMGGRLADF